MIGRRNMLALAAGGAAVAALPAPVRARSSLRGIQVQMTILINGRELVQGVDGKRVEITLQVYPSPGEPGLFRNRETKAEAAERLLADMRRRALPDRWVQEYNVDPGPDAPDVE